MGFAGKIIWLVLGYFIMWHDSNVAREIFIAVYGLCIASWIFILIFGSWGSSEKDCDDFMMINWLQNLPVVLFYLWGGGYIYAALIIIKAAFETLTLQLLAWRRIQK